MKIEVLDSLLDAAFAVNKNGELIYANPAFSQLCQVPVRRMVNKEKAVVTFFNLKDETFQNQNWLKITEATLYREVEFETPQDLHGTIQFCIQPLIENETWLVLLRDVTLEKSLNDKYREQLSAKEVVIEELKQARDKLQGYSESLEEKVKERTSELHSVLDLQTATLDSLGQGILVIDKNGICGDYFSRICPEMFGRIPAKTAFTELLALSISEQSQFIKWLEMAFLDMLPFSDMLGLLALKRIHINEKILDLEYFPLRSADELKSIVIVATDRTQELETQDRLEKEKRFGDMVGAIFKFQKQFVSFVRDGKAMLDRLLRQSLIFSEQNSELIMRDLHTIKGGAASFYLKDIEDKTQLCEDYFHSPGVVPIEATEIIKELRTIWDTSIHEIDQLLKLKLKVNERSVEVLEADLLFWLAEINVARSDEVMQDIYQKYFCEDLSDVLLRFDDEVGRLALLLKKNKPQLIIETNGFRLPVVIYNSFIQNLVHTFRNSMDHGIESPEKRLEMSKPETPTITISVNLSSDKSKYNFKIADDGSGIDLLKLKTKLLSKGHPLSERLRMNDRTVSENDILMTIFDDGFSTATEVSAVSGRGVGLSSLYAEVLKLGGCIEIINKPKVGLEFHIQVENRSHVETSLGQILKFIHSASAENKAA